MKYFTIKVGTKQSNLMDLYTKMKYVQLKNKKKKWRFGYELSRSERFPDYDGIV